MRDWRAWHTQYDDPGSHLSARLRVVQSFIRAAVDEAPTGPIRVLSVCAGQCHDLSGALAAHPRAADVIGLAVEADEHNATVARDNLRATGLTIDLVLGNAGTTTVYDGAVPAHLLIVCGVFGNITDEDIHVTIDQLDSLAHRGATAIWTRGVRGDDLTPTIKRWFQAAGWREIAYESRNSWGVGVHRLTGPPRPFVPGVRLFEFAENADG